MKNSRSIFEVLAYALLVFLDFDGSFRPPRDPGFPTIPAKMATCASSISLFSESESIPVAIGSRVVPVCNEMTSSHVEFHGVLLGLEQLLDLCTTPELLLHDRKQNSIISPLSSKKDASLCIRGDCKTVIDQLSGNATPRKLSLLHSEAIFYLEKLKRSFGKIEFHHVPRSQNTLCDNICSNTMEIVSVNKIKCCWEELQQCDKATTFDNSSVANSSAESKAKEPEQRNIADIYARYFQPDSRCRIKYSIRPSLYSSMASLARRRAEFSTLMRLGELQAKDANGRKEIAILGVKYQIDGWRGMGNEKKARFLERKHRFRLDTLSDRSENEEISEWDFPEAQIDSGFDWDSSIEKKWHELLVKWTKVATATADLEDESKIWICKSDE